MRTNLLPLLLLLAPLHGAPAPRTTWLKQDRAMHRALPAKPLAQPRTVRRFTSLTRAQQESKTGIAPGSHLAARAAAGRLPSPAAAKRAYGLPRNPTAVETIRVPKGQPLQKGRVWAQSRKRWEWTSPKPIPPGNIRSVQRLRESGRKP